MEKFMYLFRDTPGNAQPSPEQMQASMQKWLTWIDKLTKDGRYEGGEPLLPTGKLVKGKSKVVTDGPFTESKELVSGYFVIKAKDLTEAVELSKDCPIFENNGAVEVRQVQKIDL